MSFSTRIYFPAARAASSCATRTGYIVTASLEGKLAVAVEGAKKTVSVKPIPLKI